MHSTIGVRAQSTLGDMTFLPEKIFMKNQQNARIVHYFAGKISKIPKFL